jgi:PAS domain S-box-containing protein
VNRFVAWITRLLQPQAATQQATLAEAHLNELLHIAADAIITIDHQQHIVRFNRGAEEVFGYAAHEVIGQPLDLLLPERFIGVHRRHVDGFSTGTHTARLMGHRDLITGRRKTGEEFPAEASISRLVVGDDMLLTVILRDVSERKAAEDALRRSEERFRRVFNYSNDAIFVIDPAVDGAILDVNPKACTLFGYGPDEFVTLHIADIYPRDSHTFAVFAKSVMQQGTGWTDELVCLTKTGELFPVEVSASLVAFADQHLMIALMRDIRERKAVERMKEAFISNVSHELRTPIANIKLHHALLERNPAKREVYLDRLARETDRLNNIVEDLLQLSRLEQDHITRKFKAVDLNRLITQYAEDRAALAASQQIALAAEPQPELPPVQADEGLIGQVLSILLSNAFNYTPEGGSVTICTLTGESDDQAWIGFRVSDSGPGIPPAELPHVFDRFYRGTAGQESGKPGTGLGLAIAQQIVARHGGRIEVTSHGPGDGSAFTVWLPA